MSRIVGYAKEVNLMNDPLPKNTPPDASTLSTRTVDEDEREIVVGPREQLFHLLAEASEIEHTLMCSYLYAAFSLKSADHPGFSAREADALSRWRKEIVAVATEEMVHLLLVSNLSIALGGRPHFDRPNFPVAPGYFPSGVVVKLTPFNIDTLDHFIFLERPRGVELDDGAGFEAERDYEREQAHLGLMPSVQDYTTIGRLYDALRLNLIASARRLGEERLFIGPVSAQVGTDIIEMEGVSCITDLRSALGAIDTIIDQGEGSTGDREDSHYHRFLKMREEFEDLTRENPTFAPAWPAAESPVMRLPPEPEGKVFVDDPLAARVLDFANASYGLLLRFLLQAFGRQDASPVKSRYYIDSAITLMHILAQSASVLATLAASPSVPGVNAGMSFTMLRGVESFFIGSAERQLVAERLMELASGARHLARLLPALNGIEPQLRKLIRELK